MTKRFVFNDESVTNSYGFSVLTAGIDTSDFEKNPICLYDHKNTTRNVLGTWSELQVKKGQLSGVPVFDTEDADGKEVVRKVTKGTLKACSMGLFFKKEDMQIVAGKVVLTKCRLFEVSIVAVPSNANAIALYNESGEMLSDEKVQSLCLSVQGKQPSKQKDMKDLKLHLNLGEGADAADVLAAVKGIEAKLATANKERDDALEKVKQLEDEKTAQLKADFEAELATAVKDGRLDAACKDDFLQLAGGNYENATALLKKMPKQKSITDELKDEKATLAKFDKMTWKELDKGNHLAMLKAEHKEYYVERFKEEFGEEPKNV